MQRREFLHWCAGAAATTVLPGFALAAEKIAENEAILKPTRQIMLRSIHTGETGAFTYMVDGHWVRDELKKLFYLLRDHRNDQVHPIDGELLEQLYQLQQLDPDTPFNVISAYRSPETNDMLRKRGRGVAKKSYHLSGQAIDVALPGTSFEELHKAAVSLEAGGVGKYPSIGFIHVDTGPVRQWG